MWLVGLHVYITNMLDWKNKNSRKAYCKYGNFANSHPKPGLLFSSKNHTTAELKLLMFSYHSRTCKRLSFKLKVRKPSLKHEPPASACQTSVPRLCENTPHKRANNCNIKTPVKQRRPKIQTGNPNVSALSMGLALKISLACKLL